MGKKIFRINYFLILLIVAVLLTNCTTPKHIAIPNKPSRLVNKNIKININEFRVNPLTKKDNISDIEKLEAVFVNYMQLNNSYNQIQEYYPDAYLNVIIEPSKTVKRTWILDIPFFYPCPAYWPISPRWGQTNINLKLSIDIPSVDNAQYNFFASNKYTIICYPYYKAGKILTQKFSITYSQLFSQISKYDFYENWTGYKKNTDLLESKNKTIISEKISVAENKNKTTVFVPNKISDVDKNIPLNYIQKTNTFVLIIGNEDYSSYQMDLTSEVNVDYAENDAKIFKEYAIKTLGIPEENITYLINAKAIEMHRAVEKMNLLAKNSQGEGELILYYAGHGFPDEITKEPYLIPVDVSGSDLKFAIKLKDIYTKLTEYPTIFLDACFSGGARNQGLLATRGIKIKPKYNVLSGNLIVFTSSSGDQSSLQYQDKQHGLFTYFLLKKLQDTKGDLTYGELSDYLMKQVGIKSVMIYNKEQNPKTNVSPSIQNEWKNWKIK